MKLFILCKQSLRIGWKRLFLTAVILYCLLIFTNEWDTFSCHKSKVILQKTDYRFNHTNSSTYTGPIVKGWPSNKSRVLEHYVPRKLNSFTTFPKKIDTNSTELLIIIKTRFDNYAKRKEVRGSWAKHLTKLSPHSRIIFLIGQNEEWTNPKELQDEINKYNDILQGSFIDSYNNLTLKTVSAYKFVAETIKWIQRPKIVITIDDDVFLNVPLLLKKLNEFNNRCNDPYLSGHVFRKPKPFRDAKDANFSSKWGIPTYMYADEFYPKYIYGIITIMSFQTVSCLFEESYNLPYFHIEDIFTTGFSAKRCGIEPQQMPGVLNLEMDLETFNVTHHIAFLNNVNTSKMYQQVEMKFNLLNTV